MSGKRKKYIFVLEEKVKAFDLYFSSKASKRFVFDFSL